MSKKDKITIGQNTGVRITKPLNIIFLKKLSLVDDLRFFYEKTTTYPDGEELTIAAFPMYNSLFKELISKGVDLYILEHDYDKYMKLLEDHIKLSKDLVKYNS